MPRHSKPGSSATPPVWTPTPAPTPPSPPTADRHPPEPHSHRRRRTALVPGLDPGICLPTPEQIAAEVRRRPIGAVIADICRDLGIMPNHPLWRELRDVIIRYGGNLASLVKDICEQAFQRPALSWPLSPLPAPAPQFPASGTDPP